VCVNIYLIKRIFSNQSHYFTLYGYVEALYCYRHERRHRALQHHKNSIWSSDCHSIHVNIYAPSGAAKRNEREHSFNSELTYLMRAAPAHMILGGDCVLDKRDTTGHLNFNHFLAELVQGFTPRYSWAAHPATPAFTHYSNNGATRIDRLYISHTLHAMKTSAITVPAAFTDHLAVVLRLSVETPLFRMGRGIWKMNTPVMANRGNQTQTTPTMV